MARRKRPTIKADNAAIALYGMTKQKPEEGSFSVIPRGERPRLTRPAAGTPEREQHDRLSALLGPKAQAVAQQGLRVAAQGGQSRRRQRWEKKNPERFLGAQDLLPDARNLNPRQISAREGWDVQEGSAAVRQDAEPHPHMLENPPRWEDMHPKQQARVLAAAADYGVTPESMKRSFSTQLQRGLIRDPGHASFYSERGQTAEGHDLPRERLEKSAAAMEVPFHVTAAANAITSPQMPFIQVSHGGSKVAYPNDDTARAAIGYAQAGMSGEDYQREFAGNYPHQGYPANMARAIDVSARLMKGENIRDVWKPGGRPGAGSGDKVRPYYNAWVDPTHPEGNFLVSDTHTGVGGMAPHLAGTPHETKYLSIAGIHSLHDKIARDVVAEHGLTSVSRAQSLQWNQEKLEASDMGSASAMYGGASVAAMRPANRNANPNQFGGE